MVVGKKVRSKKYFYGGASGCVDRILAIAAAEVSTWGLSKMQVRRSTL